jgi:N-carbamoyl-L-amino-acid hydrolase
MSKVTQAGMIFVPSRNGKSHSPLEFTRRRDLVNGSNVLLNVLARLTSL